MEDASGHEWRPHITPDPGDFHWDVQHPNGTHTNIGPDGEGSIAPDTSTIEADGKPGAIASRLSLGWRVGPCVLGAFLPEPADTENKPSR